MPDPLNKPKTQTKAEIEDEIFRVRHEELMAESAVLAQRMFAEYGKDWSEAVTVLRCAYATVLGNSILKDKVDQGLDHQYSEIGRVVRTIVGIRRKVEGP